MGGRSLERFKGGRPFRVRVADLEDLAVVSTHLQDAVAPVSEIAYLPDDKRFVMVVSRFRWETASQPKATSEDGEALFERVHTAIRIENVSAVRTKGFDRSERDKMLNLLRIAADKGVIELLFADNCAIRLDVAGLSCHVEDIGEPWPTVFKPEHDTDDVFQEKSER